MSFSDFDGKKEVRFDNFKKFNPDPGKYFMEISENIDTKYNEKSGITSLVIDMKTISELEPNTLNDTSNLGINVRMYIADGNKVAALRLKALIYFSGVAKYFDENYEDIPTMDNSEWNNFLKDVRDKLAFRKVGVEIIHNPSKDGKVFANVSSFFAAVEPVKVPVPSQNVPQDFKWTEENEE